MNGKISYQRSLSAKSRRERLSVNSKSPRRFDPTAWAREKQEKIERAKENRTTFGTSNSRSVSPAISRTSNRSQSRKLIKNKIHSNHKK